MPSLLTTMRARPNAARPRPPGAPPPPLDGTMSSTNQEDDDNGKGKSAPKRKFRLPPPPKMASLSFASPTKAGSNGIASLANGDQPIPSAPVDTGNNSAAAPSNPEDVEMGNSSAQYSSGNSPPHQHQLPPPPALPIPAPQHTSSAAYQRGKNNPYSVNKTATNTPTADTAMAEDESDDVEILRPHTNTTNNAAIHSSYATYNNPYQSHQSAYRPSIWYANARDSQRRKQRLQSCGVLLSGVALVAFLWWSYYHLQSSWEEKGQHHHKHRHYHHGSKEVDHNHLHAMIGIAESPLGFAMYSDHVHQKQKSMAQRLPQSQSQNTILQQQTVEDTFSNVPVVTLSNQRLLPYIGFGVASHSIEHKQIPIIVSTLLQYASSENEGGGGIAMIDAVIDEKKEEENVAIPPGNKELEENEEELESSMAKTVVTLVGRAISYFGKENMKRQTLGSSSSGVHNKQTTDSYDYENRLEVHLLVGLSGSDLGGDNTVQSLRNLMAELDGLTPSLPKRDLANLDASDWDTEATYIKTADHHVDTRLHVLLRLPHCYNASNVIVSCSSDNAANADLLHQWLESWDILEKLYEANILHGIGLDGTTAGDLSYLIEHSRITPMIYRGDVSQALEGYSRRVGTHSSDVELRIAEVLKEKNVTFLASNVVGHILERKDVAPNAYGLLQILGNVLFQAHREMLESQGEAMPFKSEHKGAGEYYTVPRLVLSYLVRHEVCVLPHAYKPEHLADDAPESVGGLASFLSERRVAEIGVALKALLSGMDLPEDHGLGTDDEKAVAAVFHNEMDEEVTLVQISPDGEEVTIPAERGGLLESGASVVIIAQKGDKFASYHTDGHLVDTFEVRSEAGGAHDFTITLT